MSGLLLASGCWTHQAEAAGAVKVGTTISFMDSLNTYRSQKHFAGRPITRELATHHLELCVYNGPGEQDFVASLKQFNTIWLLLEHEGMNKIPAARVGKALREYVKQGGGLVINHSPGRYPEAEVDPYWDEVFKYLDMDRLHEEVVDLPSRMPIGKGRRNAFFTREIATHPVTAGVRGLWLACRDKLGSWGSHAIRYSAGWRIVVKGPETAQSYPKDKDTNVVNYDKAGFFKTSPPLVAVRQLGKGRIVSIAAHKDNSGWNYNLDRWVNILERGTMGGKPSDMVTLLQNALLWTGQASLNMPEFTRNYQPVEPSIPPYRPNAEFGSPRSATFKPMGTQARKVGANGIIGLHSAYSDGKSGVAEYAEAAKNAGLNFIAFTDPLELLTPEEVNALRADCLKVSNDQFYACPGVEYSDSSGLRWALFHDRVAFPRKEIVIDGRNHYRVFDGKTVLERNAYGGHQNLFRGAIIDYSALAAAGADAVNLVYFSGVIPKAYDVDKVIADNRAAMLRTAANAHRYAPFSFTRIRDAKDVAKAAKASQTHARTLADIRKVCNAKGWGANDAAVRGSVWVSLGDGLRIGRYECRMIPGTQLVQIAFSVSSPAGIDEVVIHDADRRVLRRFSGAGATSLEREFVIPFDRQSYPQLIARDLGGGEAVSANNWLYRYHAGLFRCGDNSNMLCQNPGIMWFPNWDCSLAPLAKRVYTPVQKKHYHVSEAHLFGFHEPSTVPSQRVGSSNHVPLATMDGQPVDFPSQLGAASSRSVFSLVAPGVVTIIDQHLGEQEQERSYTKEKSTYANCSIQRKIGENPWYRRTHRIYQLVDRIDTWWSAVYKQIIPQYEGGFTIVEGTFTFLKDVTLQTAIDLAQVEATNPLGPETIVTPEGTVQASKTSYSGNLGEGGYVSLISDPESYYAFLPLKGGDPLAWQAFQHRDGYKLQLQLGKKGQVLKAGTVLKYRFAVGSFIRDPDGGEYLKRFAETINPQTAQSGYPVAMKQGTIESAVGFLTLNAHNHAARFTLGPKSFIQDVPIRVAKLDDNGVAMIYSALDKAYKPIAFSDGLAYTAAPMEKLNEVWVGNVFIASDPAIRMTLVPAMKNLPQAFLDVHNPTDRALRVTVRSPQGTPLYGGQSYELTLPAGASVQQSLKLN
jgi:hypothetical protein